MSERRYTDDEIAKIFEHATEAQQATRRLPASGEGMTLADLQEIGRDVGIPPALVTDAAYSLDRDRRSDSRTLLGLPIGVGRTVELDRHLSQAEWERLVVDLRETFDARGVVKADGTFRQWTNGNLQALVEPTPNGHRVRLQTTKGDARAMIRAGLGTVGVAAVSLAIFAMTGRLADPGSLSGIGILAAGGLTMFGMAALRLPSWARLRRRQMEGVAARLTLSAPAVEDRSSPRE